jgi:hypothetical protein
MKVTGLTRLALECRREELALTAGGYRKHETDWEIHRGYAAIKGHVILDAVISADSKYVYTKIGPPA